MADYCPICQSEMEAQKFGGMICENDHRHGAAAARERAKAASAVADPTPSTPPAAPGAGDPETILDAFGRAIVAYNDKVAAKADTRWAWEELMRARGSVLDRLRAIPPSPLVPAPLVWTRTKPKAEGWYFLRLPGTTSKQVERIIIDHEVGGIAKWYSDYEEDWEPVLEGREWAGPIPPPLDPKGPGEPLKPREYYCTSCGGWKTAREAMGDLVCNECALVMVSFREASEAKPAEASEAEQSASTPEPKGEPEQSSYLDQIGAKSIQLEVNRRMSENAENSAAAGKEGGKA